MPPPTELTRADFSMQRAAKKKKSRGKDHHLRHPPTPLRRRPPRSRRRPPPPPPPPPPAKADRNRHNHHPHRRPRPSRSRLSPPPPPHTAVSDQEEDGDSRHRRWRRPAATCIPKLTSTMCCRKEGRRLGGDRLPFDERHRRIVRGGTTLKRGGGSGNDLANCRRLDPPAHPPHHLYVDADDASWRLPS